MKTKKEQVFEMLRESFNNNTNLSLDQIALELNTSLSWVVKCADQFFKNK